MPRPILTGNELLDKLRQNGVYRNPEFNPKTKKGKLQPEYLVDSEAGNINQGIITNAARKQAQIQVSPTDLGLTQEDIDRDFDMGINPINPYNTEDELNKARADSQSALSKFGNFLAQAGLGEVLVGSMEGFGNIFDGAANFITEDNYEGSAYTQFFENLHNDIKDKFKIYRENPNEDWDLSDFGWWMDNAVSVASTASLLIPAAGWSRALSYAGKIGKIGKTTNIASRWISKGLSNLSKAAKTGDKFSQMRIASSINNSIRQGGEIAGTALLSRTGENYMEGRQVYDDVYTNAIENLNNMPDAEFKKFLNNNPEFVNEDGTIQSKEDIAKEIARKSANETFYNDYWMLLMDIPQFKALGSLWGKPMSRASKASERIAAENVKRTLAGKTNEELIKDNILNRTKNSFQYALKNPLSSIEALELGEGFEEMFQGIQSEKGMEVATKYFDNNFTPRSISSYLSDPSIWVQGFWGTLGGIAFNKIGQGIQSGSHLAKGLWNKKHMSAEDYEQWKRSNKNIGAEQINNVTTFAAEFVNNMTKINQNKNPFNFVVDKDTGRKVIKDGQLVEEDIDDVQKELLKQEAIDKFVTDTAFNAMDSGVYPLMQDILNSNEFDQYLTKNGANINANDKALSREISSRMQYIGDMYQDELRNVNNLNNKANPFTTIAVARNIVRNKLQIEDYDNQLNNIAARVVENDDTNGRYDKYLKMIRYGSALNQLDNLDKRTEFIDKQFEEGKISKSARDQYIKEIETQKYYWKEYLKENHIVFSKAYHTQKDILKDLTDQQVNIESRRIYTKAQIPIDENDYKNMYNEFANAMDEIARKQIDANIDKVKNYLNNAEDLDDAIDKMLKENTGDKNVDEALHSIRYGYVNPNNIDAKGQILNNLQIDAIIEEAKRNRQKAEKLQEEAKESGTILPDNNTNNTQKDNIEETNNNQQEEQNDNDTSSTGKQPTATIKNPANNNIEHQQSQQAKATIVKEETPITTNTGHENDTNPMNVEVSQEDKNIQQKLIEGIDVNSLKAELDARKYVMQIGFKQPAKLDEITTALQNKDESKLSNFIKEVTDFLIDRRYDGVTAKLMAQKAIVNVINMYGALNQKSAFGRLATQLSIGFNEKSAKKYSATELIDGKGLDDVVDDFINEFVKLTNNTKLEDGKYIINIKTLFNYLIHNENIDINTAVQIYNNLGRYMTSSVNTKYIFTGYDTIRGLYMTGEEFIHRLEDERTQEIASRDQMHISLVESLGTIEKNALLAAANGAPVHIEEQRDHRGNLSNLNIIVDWKQNNRVKHTKIGILRAVTYSANGKVIYPNSHYSGFNNILRINDDGSISLNCDKLFYAICDANTTDGFNLRNTIANYFIKRRELYEQNANGQLSDNALNKKLQELITPEFISSIVDNPLVKETLINGAYKPYVDFADINDLSIDEQRKITAIRMSEDIAKLLFYGNGQYDNNVAETVNDFAIDSYTLRERYKTWKEKVKDNYTHTYELQKSLNNNDNITSNINLNVGFISLLNTVQDNNPVNIKDQDFNLDPKDKDNVQTPYTPFVYYNNGHLVDEYGNDYGIAPQGIGDYSMGYVVYNKDGELFTAFCNSAVNMNGTTLHKVVKNELADIITHQINNINNSSHINNFNEIKERLQELFGPGGLFYFGDINIVTDSNERFVTLQHAIKEGNRYRYVNIATFYSVNKDGMTPSNAIGIYDSEGKRIVSNVTEINAQSRELFNNLIKELTKNFKLNRSQVGMTKMTKSGGTPKMFTWDSNGFTLHLGGKDYNYKNYGDFILQNGGFTTNVYSKNGEFVTRYIDYRRVNIDTSINKRAQATEKANTAVSDYLYNGLNPKRKSANVEDVLSTANVSQDKIDILLGTNSKIPFVTKRIYLSDTDDGKTNAYYDKKTKRIYITPRGATAMNGNPTNAIRLILHENIHRLFNGNNYTNAERKRIVSELNDVYTFVRNKLDEEHNNNTIDNNFYEGVIKVLDTVKSYKDEQTQMEEFVVECLTQPYFTEWLNNTQYDNESSVAGIQQKKKSILQKLMDILLNLFGINNREINDFSILAREYVILGKGIKATSNYNNINIANKNNTTNVENTQSPVEEEPESKSVTNDNSSATPTDDKLKPNNLNVTDNTEINDNVDEDTDIETDDYYNVDYFDDDIEYSATDMIDKNNKTTTEIYSKPVVDGADVSAFGVRVVNNMGDYVNSFPAQYRKNIEHILAANELNYTCS